MSPFSIDYPPGATPLDPNEVDGLIPDYITTQAELNALERENITEATNWADGRQHSDILTATFTLDGLDSCVCERQWSTCSRHDEHSLEFKRPRTIFLGAEDTCRAN